MEQSLSNEVFCFGVYGIVMLAEDAAKISDDKGWEAIIIKDTKECVVFLSESWIEREMGERSGLFGFLPTEDHRRNLPPNLQAQWFNNVPPEMVKRRTPALWRCSRGHIWIDTKEARQTLKGFDKCFECQNIVSVSGPNLSKF